MANLDGVNFGIGFAINISEKIGVGVQYQVNRASASLTEEAKQSVPFFNRSSQLYGSIVSFPSQKMSLDNINVTLNLIL